MVFLSACASLRPANEISGDAGYYRESALDVVNRAPLSMSLPDERASVPVLDHLHIRAQADYHFALAESYSLEGNSSRAVEEYKLTLVYDPKSQQVRLRLAAEYVKQGLISEAIEQAKAALEIDPNFEDGRLLLGGLYSALRMYDDALTEYKMVMKNNPGNFEAPLFVGALLAEQKKYAEAAVYFEQLAKNPNNQRAYQSWYYLGRVRLEENRERNVQKAEVAFQESLTAKPDYLEAVLALGQLYEATNRKKLSTNLFKMFQEKYGPNPVIAEELVKTYIEEKEYNRAYDQLAIIENGDPSDLNVKAKMAFILIEQKKYKEAILRLEEILALEPSSDKIRFYLGAVYEEIKDFKSAIEQFQKVPVASSYYQESVIHTSYLYKLLGDYDKAVEAIQKGIKERDEHPQFYALYASLLDDRKEYKPAAEMLTSAVSKFPDHAQLHFFLGSMQDRLGDKEGTVKSMKRVLELDKNHVQALNFLAYTYADSGVRLEEAEKLVRRALELQPNDGYILDTLGWVLFKKGKVGDAVKVLEAAYKIQPNESIIAEHLGDAYYHLQMPEKAKKLYMRAAETETNVATVEKLRSKIVSIDNQRQNLSIDEGARTPASARSE